MSCHVMSLSCQMSCHPNSPVTFTKLKFQVDERRFSVTLFKLVAVVERIQGEIGKPQRGGEKKEGKRRVNTGQTPSNQGSNG